MASTRLYVGNLSYKITEQELREVFSEGGRTVTDVFVVTDRETGRPRGFAFVEMASEDDAENAVAEMDGVEYGGRELKVNVAAERVERDSGRGEQKSRGFERGGGQSKPTRGYGSQDQDDRPSRGKSERSGGAGDRNTKVRRSVREGDRKSRDF